MCMHVEHVQLTVYIARPCGFIAYRCKLWLPWLYMKWHMMCVRSKELRHVIVTKCHFLEIRTEAIAAIFLIYYEIFSSPLNCARGAKVTEVI